MNDPQKAGESPTMAALRRAAERADWRERGLRANVASAERALNAFGSYDTQDLPTSVADLLANLMHWADAKDVDFDDALRRAHNYHRDESI